MLPADPWITLARYLCMRAARDFRDKQDTPEYYREQALKVRLAAEEPGMLDRIRDKYLEIAEGWEELARRAEHN